VGVGGSGKQSLSRLASYICGYRVYQITISGTYGLGDLKEDLKTMYKEWPFFQSTIDLIEMILAKCDGRISKLYDEVLVADPAEKKLGVELREKLSQTVHALLEVTGHKELLANNARRSDISPDHGGAKRDACA
jgi:hypothetical protein